MSKYPDKIFKSLDFTSIPEKSLTLSIKRDDLKMEEIGIWECIKRKMQNKKKLTFFCLNCSRRAFYTK